MRKVRYEGNGGIDGLCVIDVAEPCAARDHVVVRVRGSCINPGTLAALDGAPFRPVRDLSGEVVALGAGVESLAIGDAVLGWSDDGAHAELAVVPAAQLVPKPASVPWDVAASLYVSPLAALASVEAVAPAAGEVVVVSGAAGSVGLVAAQLARRTGATVLGLARPESAVRLEALGIIAVLDEAGVRAAAPRVDAFIDCVGAGHVAMAVGLGVSPGRINTIVDFAAAREHGVSTRGTRDAGGRPALLVMARLVASGAIVIPIAQSFPLARVKDAYRAVARGGAVGKIVLRPQE